MEFLKREIMPKVMTSTGWDNELMVQRENHDYLFSRKNLLFIQDFTQQNKVSLVDQKNFRFYQSFWRSKNQRIKPLIHIGSCTIMKFPDDDRLVFTRPILPSHLKRQNKAEQSNCLLQIAGRIDEKNSNQLKYYLFNHDNISEKDIYYQKENLAWINLHGTHYEDQSPYKIMNASLT